MSAASSPEPLWSSTSPTVDGYYFFSIPMNGGVLILEVLHQRGERFIARPGRPYLLDPSMNEGLWAGPIALPSSPHFPALTASPVVQRRCHFCGEGSNWGWYKIDAQPACDRCGDLLLSADDIKHRVEQAKS